jgi:hypothetical protein
MTWQTRTTQGYLEYEPHIVGGVSLHLTRQHHGSEAGHPPDLIDTRLLPYCRQSSDSAHDAKVRRRAVLCSAYQAPSVYAESSSAVV